MAKKIKLIDDRESEHKIDSSIILRGELHKLHKIFIALKSIYRFKKSKNLPVFLEDIYKTIEESTLESVNRETFEHLFFIFSKELVFEKGPSEKIEVKLNYAKKKDTINIADNEMVKKHMNTFAAINIKRRDFFTGKILKDIKSVEKINNGFEVTTYKKQQTRKENIERRKKDLLERLESRKKSLKKKFISEISENTLKSKIRYLFKVENKRTLRLDFVQKKISTADVKITREEIEEVFQVRNMFGTFYVLNKLVKK